MRSVWTSPVSGGGSGDCGAPPVGSEAVVDPGVGVGSGDSAMSVVGSITVSVGSDNSLVGAATSVGDGGEVGSGPPQLIKATITKSKTESKIHRLFLYIETSFLQFGFDSIA